MKLNLDLEKVQTMTARVVVPTGNYQLQIVEAAPSVTAKKGGLLTVKFKILAGDKEGIILTERLNIVNASEVAQRIALSTVKTILTVGGHKNPDMLADSDEMVGLKLSAYIEEQDTSFEARDGSTIDTTENVFKNYTELTEDSSFPMNTEPKSIPTPEKKTEDPKKGVATTNAAFPWQK